MAQFEEILSAASQSLMIKFRGKFKAILKRYVASGKIRLPSSMNETEFEELLRKLTRVDWNVKILTQYKSGHGVATYLARYLKGGPIGNSRLVSLEDSKITFRYRLGTRKAEMGRSKGERTLEVNEFIKRLLEHVPPVACNAFAAMGSIAGTSIVESMRLAKHWAWNKPPRRGRVKESIGKRSVKRVVTAMRAVVRNVEPNLNRTRNSSLAEVHHDGTSKPLYPRKQHDATFQIDQGPKQTVTHRTEGRAYGEELEKHRVSQANGTSLQPRMLNGECPILTKWLFTNV